MANNRMVLVCNVCVPKANDWNYTDRDKDKIYVLAKWYPAGGPGSIGGEDGSYYRNDGGENLGKEFLEFLQRHQHQEVASKYYRMGAGQENPVRIEYESEGLPIIEAK